MILDENCSIKAYTAFGIDIKSRYFTRVSTLEELKEALEYPEIVDSPILILGGGSNLLFTRDFNGLVIKNEIKGISVEEQSKACVLVTAGAGEDWDNFVAYCVENNYGGLENLSLIPGVVGTSPVQNIGAYGVEVKDTIYQVTAYDIKTGQISVLNNTQCSFGYRDSVFKHTFKDRYVILSVTFKLDLNPEFHTQYGAITTELEAMGVEHLSLRAIRDAVISIRRRKLPDPLVVGNAGSFFKNPTVDGEVYSRLHDAFPEILAFELTGRKYKLAAGWMIEKCGWKGFRDGDAGVHTNQALVLVNYGQATGSQILALAQKIKHSVLEKFGVTLEMEVNVI